MTDIPRPGDQREWRLAGIIFFALLAGAVLYATFVIIWPFLSAIALGAILVTITFPLFRRVRARLHGSDDKAAVVMLIGLTFVIIIPAVILGGLLVQQANGIYQRFQSGEAQQIVARMNIGSHLMWIRRVYPSFDPASVSPQRLLLPVVQGVPGWIAHNGAAVVGSMAEMIVTFFLILLSAYFFYAEGDVILAELQVLSPLPTRYDREFAGKFKDVIDATFRGQMMTSLAQGVAAGIGLAIAQVPGAILWGFVAAIASLLPIVGAATVWVPATLYLFISASLGDRGYFGAIFLLIWGTGVVSTIDHVVRPWAMKGKAQLPAIPLIFAILGGMQAFGFVGLVIGPLVFSLLTSVIDIYKTSFRAPESTSKVA